MMMLEQAIASEAAALNGKQPECDCRARDNASEMRIRHDIGCATVKWFHGVRELEHRLVCALVRVASVELGARVSQFFAGGDR